MTSTAVVIEAVQQYGGCGSISPDGTSICVLPKGHDGPEGWDPARQAWIWRERCPLYQINPDGSTTPVVREGA